MIPQSGSDLSIWAVHTPGHNPAGYTRQVAAQLDCDNEDTEAMMDCMRKVDVDTLRKTAFNCTVRIPPYLL